MMWSLLVDDNELIMLENIEHSMKIRIEARFNNQNWEIYKTYHSVDGKISFTEEYECRTKKEAKEIINKIKLEILTEEEINDIKQTSKDLTLSIRRVYKDSKFEKWSFSINKSDFNNYILVRYSDKLEMDIIANEKYKYFEVEILDEINKILGVNDFDTDLVQNMFFFSKKSAFYTNAKEEDNLEKIEIGIDFNNDE